MSLIDLLEAALRRARIPYRWHGRELIIETKSGDVTLEFDLADRLIKVLGPGD